MYGFNDISRGINLQQRAMRDFRKANLFAEMGLPGLAAMQMRIAQDQMRRGQNLVNLGVVQVEMGYGSYGRNIAQDYSNRSRHQAQVAILGRCLPGCTMSCCSPVRKACMGVGCTLACCGVSKCQGLGCTLSCCSSRVGMCMGIGCTLSCCSTRLISKCLGIGCTLSCCSSGLIAKCLGIGCTRSCCRNGISRCLGLGCTLSCCNSALNRMVHPSQYQTQAPVKYLPQPITINRKRKVNEKGQLQPQKIYYQGPLCKKDGLSWSYHQKISLTQTHLMSLPISHISKIKIKREYTNFNDSFYMKVTIDKDQDHLFGTYEQLKWFQNIILAKLQSWGKVITLSSLINGHIQGNILRKSKYLGNWELRHIELNKKGLRSYASRNLPPTTKILRIQQLWTRFQLVGNGQYGQFFVIKCMVDGFKYQYGLPLNGLMPWLQAFFNIMN